ncbi:MAG: hypothetical protein AAFR84_01300 [Pseudomonadota bacterium]
MDALDGVEIVTAIEETFSITISEQEAIEIRNMGDDSRLLAERHGHGNRHDIWHAVSGLARSQSGYDGPIDRATTFYTLRQAAVLPAR